MRLLVLVALTMTGFAANSLLNRVALTTTETGPMMFALLRLAAGAVFLAGLTISHGGLTRLRAAISLPKAAALAVYMLGFSLAYRNLDAGLGALILFGGVQITMFVGAALSGETLSPRRLIGGGIAFAALIWLVLPGVETAPPWQGTLLMVCAALGWGVFSLLGRGGADPIATMAGSFLLALLPALVLSLVVLDGVDLPGLGWAILSGAVTSGLCYALWYSLLPQLPAAVAAVAQLSVPPIAMFGGVVLLAEVLTGRAVAASLVILAAVALAVIPARPNAKPATRP